jgi:type IV pilus assembly protein PilB
MIVTALEQLNGHPGSDNASSDRDEVRERLAKALSGSACSSALHLRNQASSLWRLLTAISVKWEATSAPRRVAQGAIEPPVSPSKMRSPRDFRPADPRRPRRLRRRSRTARSLSGDRGTRRHASRATRWAMALMWSATMADRREVGELQNLVRPKIRHRSDRMLLGALLLADGAVTVEQLERALADVESRGCRLGEALLDDGAVSQRVLAMALARQAKLDFLDLHQVELDPTAVALLPERFARRYNALPVRFVDDDTVLVAVGDPTNLLASDDLRLALGLNLELAVVEMDALEVALAHAYRRQIEIVPFAEELVEMEMPAIEDVTGEAAASAPAIKLVNSIIGLAVDQNASDVHFEPQEREVIVRARVDGVMRQLTTLSKGMQSVVMSRLKIMAELDIAEKRAPQDGRMTVRYDGHPLDIRVAVLPTTHGEQIVLRILQRRRNRLSLSDLGMNPADLATLTRAINQPYGAVIACGPTGSGKTTTLYAALDLLNGSERVITTIEDPVEYQIPGLSQIEVNVKAGLTFARGLRTILRSDPDVLLVGEIRDDETATIAIQAAMTGHLVFSTLHTHNAASSVERLKQMGVEPSLLASTVSCIVAQRLARRLCTDCRERHQPDADDLALLGLTAEAAPELPIFRGRGCVRCAGTGYRGRAAIYEVMPTQGKLRRLLGGATEDLFAAAVAGGMTTLRQDGVRLVLEGISSVDEIRRVTGDRLVYD